MKYIKKIIFNADEFNIDLNYAKLNEENTFTKNIYFDSDYRVVSITDSSIICHYNDNKIGTAFQKGNTFNDNYYFNFSFSEDINSASNLNTFAKIEAVIRKNGNTYAQLMAYKPQHGSEEFQMIKIEAFKDGTYTTYAPNPPANSNDNNIATTQWVQNLLKSKGIA